MIDEIRDKFKSEDDTDIVTSILSKYDFNKYAVADVNGSQSIVIYKFARTLRGLNNIREKNKKIEEIRSELKNQLNCSVGYILKFDRAIIRIDPDDPRYFIHPYLKYTNIDRQKIPKLSHLTEKCSNNITDPALYCAVIISKFTEIKNEDYYKLLSENENLEYDRLVNKEIERHDIALLGIANGFIIDRETKDCIYLSYNSKSNWVYKSLEMIREEAWNLDYRVGYDINTSTNSVYIHVHPNHPMSYLAPLSGYYNAIEYYVDTLELATDFEEAIDIDDPYYDAIVIYALVMDSNRTTKWFDVIERFEDGVDRERLEERYNEVSSRIAFF